MEPISTVKAVPIRAANIMAPIRVVLEASMRNMPAAPPQFTMLNLPPYQPPSHAKSPPCTTAAIIMMPKPSSITRTICWPSWRVGKGSRKSQ